MSNFYLCATCKHRDRCVRFPLEGEYACELRGVVRDLVLGDGIEPREVCGDYEGCTDSVEQVARELLDFLDPVYAGEFRDRLHALGVGA